MRRISGLAVLGLAVAAASACGDPTGSRVEVYALATVNNRPLPQPYGGSGSAVEVTGGSVSLDTDAALTETVTIRCRDPLPSGVTSCQVEGNGTNSRTGTYSRTEGWVDFGGARFSATFTSSAVTIAYRSPGGFPVVHEYRN